MTRPVVDLSELDRTAVALAGGKGASLGELTRIPGISVPAGVCVTTTAFERIVTENPAVRDRWEELDRLAPDDRAAVSAVSAALRHALATVPIPDDLAAHITAAVAGLGDGVPCAVRSSATAEDLPAASFAGQHDSFLNVVGPAAVLDAVRRCWASLFTDRAVAYRIRNHIDPRTVRMAVVVQRMVPADAAGVLFTADPVSGNRTVTTVEACTGLGEALVAGTVTPDVYRVRNGEIVERTVVTDGRPVLTDAQVLRLEQLGRRIEAHAGGPQDIEWCLAGGEVQVVQGRPITTLFPIPAADDDAPRVYLSVGHQQMMTDALKPLGLSFWLMTTRAPMRAAGGRLWVDVTAHLTTAAGRTALLTAMGRSDPLMRDAMETVLVREFVTLREDGTPPAPPPGSAAPGSAPPAVETDPAVVTALMDRARESIATAQREIQSTSGAALLDFIRTDMAELQRVLFDPRSYQVIMAGMEAAWWLNDRLQEWLGETNAADTLTQSVPHNVTSEMGLALLDVADVIRPHPEVVAFLEQSVANDAFLGELAEIPGGAEAGTAIEGWLEQYGMRCVGEIDITRPRWRERPATLLPVLLNHVKHAEPGAAARRFEQGRREAEQKEAELLDRLRALPDGDHKAAETKAMIDRVRTFAGYREFPKYAMVCRYWVYKQALLAEADRLVTAEVLDGPEDVFFLTFDELCDVVRTGRADPELIRRRRDEFRFHQTLIPPRVLTSEGECLSGAYRRDDLPPGALVGLAVSAGTAEGRARVVTDLGDAELEPGDILVTPYTDPSWTPLLVAASGLVTEVGGLMTHGAVIAREYGLPAVVGVERATTLIRDGQRIRVHGTNGYVEFLGGAARSGA